MELLVAVVIIALIAAVVFAVMQRRTSPGTGARGLGRRTSTPVGTRRGASHRDPMAAAVAEHARANDPHEVVAAERRLQAQAGQVAAGLQADALRSEQARASDDVGDATAYGDPRLDGYVDPDAQLDPDDPRYDDPRYDGRLAGDYVDRRGDDRLR